ncbi:MAG: methyltransferase domain-containing protein [Actinomycetota bacterium]|nr:methyltransferase domain-containing protein [Actinomycetota bacterium]
MPRTFTRLPPALDRALPLLAPWAREEGRLRQEGYLDLVGDSPPASTGTAQDLMVTRLVPAIYERWWRPGLGRVAKGLMGPGMQEEHRIARLLLGLSPGDGVLDVACGTGNFTRDFARTVGPDGLVVGIDLSETMLAHAVSDTHEAGLLDRTAYVRGDAAELPFVDSSFDGVCCFAALHLFADPLRALDRMTAVLTPGGRIAIFTSAQGRTPLLRPWAGLAGRRSGMRIFEQEEVVEALRDRGYVEVQQRITGVTQFVGGRLAS